MALFIRDFLFYFYVEAPNGFEDRYICPLIEALNVVVIFSREYSNEKLICLRNKLQRLETTDFNQLEMMLSLIYK